MEIVTGLTDQKRIGFIEHLCSSKELIEFYRKIEEELNIANSDMKLRHQSEIELKSEKRKVVKDLKSVENQLNLVENFNEQVQQYSLFRLFHNKKFEASVEENAEGEIEKLEKMNEEREENFHELKLKIEKKLKLEDEAREIEENLLELDKERSEKYWEQQRLQLKVDNIKKCLIITAEASKFIEEIERNVEKSQEEMKKLEAEKEASKNFLEHKQEFQKLRQSFDGKKENIIAQNNINTQKLLCGDREVKILEAAIDRESKYLKKSKEELDAAIEKLNSLKISRHNSHKKILEIENKTKEIEVLEKNLVDLEEKLYRSRENAKNDLPAMREKIFSDLKKKFHSHILGRISDFWNSENENDQKFIARRLGKLNHAIVVDNKVTAAACIEFLKIKQLTEIDEVFLPLIEIPDQATTVNIPKNFPVRKIDSLFICESQELMKAVLHCLTPSIVCETLKQAEKATSMKEFSKVQVLSMEGAGMMAKEGFLESAKICEEFNFSSEEILQNEKLKVQEKANLLRYTICEGGNEAKIVYLRNEIEGFNSQINLLENKLRVKKNSYESNIKIQSKRQEDVQRIITDEDRVETRKLLEKLQNDLKKTRDEFFQEFCQKAGVKNVQVFEEILKMSSNTKKIENLNTKIEGQKKEIKLYRLQTDKFRPNFNDYVDEVSKLTEVTEKLIHKESEVDVKIEENIAKKDEILKAKFEIYTKEKVHSESFQKIAETFEKFYDDLAKVQENSSENFEIIGQHFMNQMQLPVTRGSLKDFVMPQEDLPENVHLVKHQLEL